MKCPYCQTEYQDSLTACPTCTAYAQGQHEQQARFPTAVELLRGIGSSINLLFIATILYTVYCGITFLTSFSLPVFDLLTVAGLWLFYSECKKTSADPYTFPDSSLKLLKIIETIKLVVCWIAAIALGIITLILILVSTAAKGEDIPLIGSLLTLIMAICACLAVYYVINIITVKGIINYIKGAISSIQTGTRPQKLSSSTPYLMITLAVLSIIGSVASIFVLDIMMDWITDFLSSSLSSAYIAPSAFAELGYASMDELVSDITFSKVTVIPGMLSSMVMPVASILFALFLLKAKNIVDNSYYPTAEEYFYQRQDYYNQASAAYYAQQSQYAQQPYVQQPPQYQAPAQPSAQPQAEPQAEAQPTQEQHESTESKE